MQQNGDDEIVIVEEKVRLFSVSYHPTMVLRWVKPPAGDMASNQLQQKWVSEDGEKILWRYIDVVSEISIINNK